MSADPGPHSRGDLAPGGLLVEDAGQAPPGELAKLDCEYEDKYDVDVVRTSRDKNKVI